MQLRYSPVQIFLHWLTVLLMFSILPVAWILDSVTEETPQFFYWMDIHESIGICIFGLTALRITWRSFDPAPDYPRMVPIWSRVTAKGVHFGLLIAMLVMPVSGFLWATGHGHAVAPFDLITFPKVAFNRRSLGDAAKAIHLYGRWFLYGLIALHLAGVSFHLVFKRDGLLGRMLPPQALGIAEDSALQAIDRNRSYDNPRTR